MLDAKKPSIARDIPNWMPIVATIAILTVIGGSVISTTVFIKVLTGALTAVMAYIAVCFACHAVAMICDVLGGLGSIFQSWR